MFPNESAPAAGTAQGAGIEHIGEALGSYPTARRRLPPYGRHILHVRRRGNLRGFVGTSASGRYCTVWLLVGSDAWDLAQYWRATRLIIVAPTNADPRAFDWSPLAAADPVLLVRVGSIDGAHLERVLAAVMRDGVQRVFDLYTGDRYIANHSEVADVIA